MKAVAPADRHRIDEQIFPFKGWSPLKQYIKSKPHKWGYKVFTRAGSSAIMNDFIIYEGKGTAHGYGFGISSDIVIDLVKGLPGHKNHKLFFDNWFTSLCLVKKLKCKGFLCVGTVRVDRTQKRSLALLSRHKKEAPQIFAWMSSLRLESSNGLITAPSTLCQATPVFN